MADGERDFLPTFGYDYDLIRWSTGKTDASGQLVWRESLPANRDWSRIQVVTVEWEDEQGNVITRNARISPDRPLDVYGTDRKRPGEEYFYDLDDLVWNLWITGSP